MVNISSANPVSAETTVTGYHTRHEGPNGFSDYPDVAAQSSGSHSAVLDQLAERREGVGHARRDRPALRAAPRTLRSEAAALGGISLIESVREDPGDHRSARP